MIHGWGLGPGGDLAEDFCWQAANHRWYFVMGCGWVGSFACPECAEGVDAAVHPYRGDSDASAALGVTVVLLLRPAHRGLASSELPAMG
jgi:hypothetical protein